MSKLSEGFGEDEALQCEAQQAPAAEVGEVGVLRIARRAEVAVVVPVTPAVGVEVGDIVKKGQTIGSMGSSGRSTGPHVHFEVLKDGRHVDPGRYVARRRT